MNGTKIQTGLTEGGNAAPKIIQYSEKENFDTIIMGRSGMFRFQKGCYLGVYQIK